MLNYLKKFTVDILPSVAATVIGAYIVNHYINTKPATDAPASAAVSTANPKKADPASAAKSADVAGVPAPGVKAKGISERALIEKSASEGAATATEKAVEKAQADKPQADKQAEKPSETASIPPAEARKKPSLRERVVAKITGTPAPAPVATSPAAAPAVPTETATAAPEEHRDATDLARAAIERLRGGEGASKQQAARAPEQPRGQETPRVVLASPVQPQPQPLPPPVVVSNPALAVPAAPSDGRRDDTVRPTPPAEIPLGPPPAPPLDLRAEAAADAAPPRRANTNVADDVLSAAKSMFNAVLPKNTTN
ncbi:hypothetical protein [Bradyrhizobium sp. NP1]|uniref:hypothetical protein n=1 Tax=Bradyrhizobium sp. NP1 TaxID=3049772 RepID=UPI0025A5C993|nr:hypothetical protein [Bradyrhizobium sp. NP1]WJR77526.1 hypothetical protein QOU61_33230 [Bradyrhizobium sp. NP1]